MLINVVVRVRKLDIVALAVSLVLMAGSDDSGRQADAYSKYLEEAEDVGPSPGGDWRS